MQIISHRDITLQSGDEMDPYMNINISRVCL